MDKLKKGAEIVWKFVLSIGAYIAKNLALLVGVVEALAKAIAGIISLTAIKRKDVVLEYVDKFFSWIKKGLYWISDKLGGITNPDEELTPQPTETE